MKDKSGLVGIVRFRQVDKDGNVVKEDIIKNAIVSGATIMRDYATGVTGVSASPVRGLKISGTLASDSSAYSMQNYSCSSGTAGFNLDSYSANTSCTNGSACFKVSYTFTYEGTDTFNVTDAYLETLDYDPNCNLLHENQFSHVGSLTYSLKQYDKLEVSWEIDLTTS